jgi:hypothetical protein
MVQIRYILYFAGITLLTWLLTQMEIIAPGSLKLHVFAHPGDTLGTSEYSPVEIIQVAILRACGGLYAWVAQHCPSQRPIAIPFGGLAAIFVIRELDYFLDRYVADNFWQVIMAVISALLIVYTYRNRRRFRIAWLRVWPSPGLTLLFAGAAILFSFVRLIGHEPLWVAILGDDYQRVVKLAVEELMEIAGYYFWLIGTIEYTYQAKAIALREPQPAVAKRRERRRKKSGGNY